MVQPTQPGGLQESSRWSESAETTGKVVIMTRTPEGCQTLRCNFTLTSGTFGVRSSLMTFPVVSADSDHRLLSGNPSGC